MLRLLHSIFTSPSGKTAKPDEALIERAIERVIDGTDTRFRAVMGYRKKLRSAVEHAVEYVIDLAEALPPAIEFSRRQYGTDARLRAFFASTNRLQEMVSCSQAIRSYVSQSQPPVPGMIYAGLGVEQEERKTLGMALVGDILQRDVKQVVVNFRNHRFVAISDDEVTTRWELKKRGFDNLIQTALQRLVSERTKRDELAQERQLLRRKLQALTDGRWGLESVFDREDSKPVDTATVEKRIAEIEAEVGRIKTKAMNLDDYLTVVAATLGAPHEHLRIDAISLTLDSMGVKVAEGSHPSVNTLRLNEFSTSDGRHAIILLVAIPWGEVPQPPSDPFKEASRYL
jgi:hypothetical protein